MGWAVGVQEAAVYIGKAVQRGQVLWMVTLLFVMKPVGCAAKKENPYVVLSKDIKTL